ncbi:MAG: FAD-dependent oxidoreductase [Mucilaginibacter sp.]|nr:FAD-dependent oxidoreductase [Mucilaginibacter sp.]
MIKKLILILFVSYFSSAYAQTVKTDVLVIGGTPGGVAAAIQSARSKVKTILVERDSIPLIYEQAPGQSGQVFVSPGGTTNLNGNLSSGIWDEFRTRFRECHKGDKGLDTSHKSLLSVDSRSGGAILKKMMDSVKNLTVFTNSTFLGIKKDNEYWEVTITQNGKPKVVRARVIVDATPNGVVLSGAGAASSTLDSILNTADSKLYRTAIAVGDGLPGQHYNDIIAPKGNYPPFPTYSIPMKAVVAKQVDNLLYTENLFPTSPGIGALPRELTIGQGVGAIAAYCAFFKTTTKSLKVRIIQGELLDFKGCLLPFADVPQKDRDWRAIQQVGAAGVLKGEKKESGFVFMADGPVATAEIKPVLTEIYTRAFLWFEKEKPGEKFTVGNTLSLISDYTLTDPVVLNARIKSDWKTRYQFKLDFDTNRPITRREFAVLINRYLNPFARTVDLKGNLVN